MADRPWLTQGSLFAGVGGVDLGFQAAGYHAMWQVEIDPWCQAVLRKHWPAALLKGDVREVHGAHLSPVTVITFGSPCQDMSVAGARAGLDGDKSVLFYEATRIIGEMREASNGRCPAWAVWENVPGALSSDSGNDFASVIDALAAVGAVEIEWRVLDARFFGVPQRRRRLFVLAGFHPRAGSATPVLLESPSGQRRPAPRPAAGEDIAGTLGAGSAGGGWADDTDRMTFIPLAARCVTARGERLDGETDTLLPVSFAWQAAGKNDASSAMEVNQTMTLPCSQTLAVAYSMKTHHTAANGAGKVFEGYTPGLQADSPPLAVAYPLAMRGRDEGAELELGEADTYNALRAGDGGSSRQNGLLTPDLAVRRLTPRECERLMGWPDDHTRWAADGREISDSHRYRMCGNGVVAPVAEWIARRLQAVDCAER